jgi:DNA-binding FadR family transcriptional regulator
VILKAGGGNFDAGLAGAYGAGRLPTEHDIAFMEVAAAGNRFLYRLTDGIRAYLHTMPARLGTWDDDPQVQIGQHRAVYAAMAAGDASAASAAMLQHLRLALVQFDQLRARLDPQEGSGEAAS